MGIDELEQSIYERRQLAIVTDIKFMKNDDGSFKLSSRGKKIYSGFVSVRVLTVNLSFDWVRWTNPLMGQTQQYGIVSCPCVNDTVFIDFDPRGWVFVCGKITYMQGVKPNGFLQDFGVLNQPLPPAGALPVEADDFRLQLEEGEVLVRGPNQQSSHYRSDGSIVLKINDTIDDSDTLIFKLDSSKNVTISGAGKVQITANEADIISDNINLGAGMIKAPIIRNTDQVLTVDPWGIPMVSQQYLTNSQSVKSS